MITWSHNLILQVICIATVLCSFLMCSEAQNFRFEANRGGISSSSNVGGFNGQASVQNPFRNAGRNFRERVRDASSRRREAARDFRRRTDNIGFEVNSSSGFRNGGFQSSSSVGFTNNNNDDSNRRNNRRNNNNRNRRVGADFSGRFFRG